MIRETQYLQVEEAVKDIMGANLKYEDLARELEKLIGDKYGYFEYGYKSGHNKSCSLAGG
ncbi:hypothetical protein [Pseudomonas aeruginosa]|uniref:hypothetical protein n=1 Tax=Pseudomonas aeruginosa TaxID=287 RepID=UPI00141BE43F|nr:hypothetical protein [Pseudomonas aeruginosa]MCD2910544.1 hypothetical protein [Pseudomonas aeruginosa]HCL3901202.1 hypothetical protein [Pseudomonas aeruginosa]HDY6510963.1 hypothetical protein [Pseudomonas aeruginosa]HED8921138.1 hypothetical protein [Pseudomonas aeruginosa]